MLIIKQLPLQMSPLARMQPDELMLGGLCHLLFVVVPQTYVTLVVPLVPLASGKQGHSRKGNRFIEQVVMKHFG